jgi:hypothetical protein
LIDVEDGQATLAQNGDRDRAQIQGLPLVARRGVEMNVTVAIGDLVERKELLRGCTGGSTNTRVQAEFGTVNHGVFVVLRRGVG